VKRFFVGRKYIANLYILTCRVASLDVPDESEIHWKDLQDTDGMRWSGSNLRKRWNHLRETVNDSENKTHQGL
jgi:hypothetical protein